MKNRPKLVHIISSLKQGGAENLLIDLIKRLDNYEHHVIYFHDGPNRNCLQHFDIMTYHVHGLISLYDPIFWFRLMRLVYHLRPDCIHSALWAANLAGRLLAKIFKIPIVSVIHLGIHQDGKIRNMIDHVTFTLSEQVITVSQEIADSLKNRSWIPNARIMVIPNGIDMHAVQKEAKQNPMIKQDLSFETDTILIGSVGRLIPRKNHQLLLRSFAQLIYELDNAHLLIIGFGPLENKLKALSIELGIRERVRFEINKRAHSYFPLLDCFVLPSYQEGISIALLEAMCFSLPCIVTSPTESHEVITSEKNGIIIPSNNQEKLTEALRRILKCSSMRKALGAQAHNTVCSDFSSTKMINKYKTVFNDKIAQKKECPL